MMELSKKKKKELVSRARMMKARAHLGKNGVQWNTKRALLQAFEGTCVKPTPSDVVRVRIHETYRGSIESAVDLFCEGTNIVFVEHDVINSKEFLVFWKPESR